MRRIGGSIGCVLKPCRSPSSRRPLLRWTALSLPSSHCHCHSSALCPLHQPFSRQAHHPAPTTSSPRPTTAQQRNTRDPSFVSFLSTSPADTHSLASALAAHSRPGDVLLLYGAVGEGKTELARGFLRAYTGMSDLIVTSPTYTVMLEYAHAGHRVHHVDLYRLDKPGDLALLPLQHMFATDVTLVEWPERLTEVPPQALTVRLEKLAGETQRKRYWRVITLAAHTGPWRARIEQWKEKGLPGLSIHKSIQE